MCETGSSYNNNGYITQPPDNYQLKCKNKMITKSEELEMPLDVRGIGGLGGINCYMACERRGMKWEEIRLV